MDKKENSLYRLIDNNLQSINIKKYQKGDLAEGVVEKIDPSFMLVKVDSVFDVLVPASEMARDGKDISKGDKVKVFIMKPEDEYGVMVASQKRTTTSQRWLLLEESYKSDEPVLVNVVDANSGGLIVNIDGVIGFIPTSQLDPNRVYKFGDVTGTKEEIQKDITRKLAELIGIKIKVKIMEIDKEKSKVIFSERLFLNDQSSELRQHTIKNVKIGDVFDATVTAVTNYGIFVNAEGLDGLVHVSEISWDKVENPAEYATVGSKIKVKLIDISEDGKRVAYSIKQLTQDPWSEVATRFKVGSKVKGQITEIEDYGIIVKIGQGITGLIHKSELGVDQIRDPRDHFKVGDEVEAVILTISPSERKMGLSIKRLLAPKKVVKKSKSILKSQQKKPSNSLDVTGAFAKAGITLEQGSNDEASEK